MVGILLNYPLLGHLTPRRKEAKKKKKRIMIRASQTTTPASFLVQVQLCTIKFPRGLDWQGIIKSRTEKRGSCSQLTLLPPQRPKRTESSAESVNGSFSLSRLSSGKAGSKLILAQPLNPQCQASA